MTLEIDGFKVVHLKDEFYFGEVMSNVKMEKEQKQRATDEAIDNIICIHRLTTL